MNHRIVRLPVVTEGIFLKKLELLQVSKIIKMHKTHATDGKVFDLNMCDFFYYLVLCDNVFVQLR